MGKVPVSKREWESRQEKCRSILEVKSQWLDIKEMLRCMSKRYGKEKETDHTDFRSFYDESRTLWRESSTSC